jgi:gamma-D-glutamyl-L-lysine dipeptidyl-peptidase
MFYGICHIAVLPVRNSPSDKDEMINQLLFGEEFTVIEEKNNRIKIKGGFDNFIGWTDKKGVMEISGKTFLSVKQDNKLCIAKKILSITRDDGTKMFILPGSSLPFFNTDSLILTIENKKYLLDEHPGHSGSAKTGITDTARIFINAPYLPGGRSLFGIDGSGFTQVVYKMNGIKISRGVEQQFSEGIAVSEVNSSKPGDMAFFLNPEGGNLHVGIILENRKIIHVSGRVRLDKFDEKGIVNIETDSYSHYLKIIKRYREHSV